MKLQFIIAAAVVLALASGAQSSIVADISGLGINNLGVAAAGPLLAQGPISLGWGFSVPIAAAPAGGATYVAKTRGAVHTAPLPGHVQSAASVNVAPAPGTW